MVDPRQSRLGGGDFFAVHIFVAISAAAGPRRRGQPCGFEFGATRRNAGVLSRRPHAPAVWFAGRITRSMKLLEVPYIGNGSRSIRSRPHPEYGNCELTLVSSHFNLTNADGNYSTLRKITNVGGVGRP